MLTVEVQTLLQYMYVICCMLYVCLYALANSYLQLVVCRYVCMGPLLTRVARVFRRLNLDFKVHCMSGKRVGTARNGSALESFHVE